jgi:hypothetical protein
VDGDAGPGRNRRIRATLRSIIWHVAFALLVGVGVYIAWRVHLRAETPERVQAPAATPGERTAFLPSPDEPQGPGPGFLALDADPGRFAPPPGAERLWAGRLTQHGAARQIARYRLRGQAQQVRRHYRDLLGEAGYRLALTTRDPRRAQRIVWQRGRDAAVLSLRPGQENEKLVLFWLTVWASPDSTKP